MWLKPHRWVDVPGTRYERRKVLNVRESTHTAMVFDRKYLNIETGKFDTDKLCTLNSMSLLDFMIEESPESYVAPARYRRKRDRRIEEERKSSVYNFPKHVPKDNDFDEELRREQAAKIAHEKAIKERQDKEYALKRLEEHRRILEEQHIELQKKKDAYAKQLAETEERLMKERNERFERMQQANQLRYVGNVRPNVWKPK